MALQGFIQKDFYSKITNLQVDVENKIVSFVLSTFDKKEGPTIFNDVTFIITEEGEIQNYIEKHKKEIPSPVYPELCKEREKLVPMWTPSTPQPEINAYENALMEYEKLILKYKESVQQQDLDLMEEAKRLNTYRKYFEKSQMMGRSNPLACAYEYIKSLPGFIGVNND
jgi:hypothetical protein